MTLNPIPQTFTTMLAAREFKLIRETDAPEALLVEIGTPVQDVETVSGLDWRCPVRFTLDGVGFIKSACGVDAFQALRESFALIRWQGETLAEDKGAVFSKWGKPVIHDCK